MQLQINRESYNAFGMKHYMSKIKSTIEWANVDVKFNFQTRLDNGCIR